MDDSIILKTCKRCGEAKPKTLEFFPKQGKNAAGVQQFNSHCKPCKLLSEAEKRAADPEKYRAYALKHHYANRERLCAKMREYYWSDPAKNSERCKRRYRANHAESLARVTTWRAANRDKARKYGRAAHHKRRVAIDNSATHFTAADITKQLEAQKNKCYWCRKKLVLEGEGAYQIDHIFPLSRGGSNGPENICCSCPNCNHSKGAKAPLEFAGRLF